MENRKKLDPSKRALDQVTAIVVVLTLFTSIVGVYLVHLDGERALSQAHQDSDAALKSAKEESERALIQAQQEADRAAKAAADATQLQHQDVLQALARSDKANKISDQSLKAVQRAFINIDALHQDHPTDGSSVLSALYSPEVVNNGVTPATIDVMVALEPRDFCEFNRTFGGKAADVAAAFVLGAPSDPEQASRPSDRVLFAVDPILRNVVLGPHATILPVESRGGERVNNKDLYSNILNIRQLKYFYGFIAFHDVFEKSHKVKYCFRIMRTETMTQAKEVVVSRCTHWNCSDQSCDDDRRNYEADLLAWRHEKSSKYVISNPEQCSRWQMNE